MVGAIILLFKDKSNVQLKAISHVKFLPNNSCGYHVHAKQITTHWLIENIVITFKYSASQQYDHNLHLVGNYKLGPSTPFQKKWEKNDCKAKSWCC
jgi:hypothetical protein